MDVKTTMLLTLWDNLTGAVLTAICVGIIVFLWQKRIEIKLYEVKKYIDEKFEKSMVVFQTKFETSHKATIETLGNLHQKAVDVYLALLPILFRAISEIKSSKAYVNFFDDSEYGKYLAEKSDFAYYFVSNSHHLPENIKSFVQDINFFDMFNENLLKSIMKVRNSLDDEIDINVLNMNILFMNGKYNLNLQEVHPTTESLSSLLSKIVEARKGKLDELEALYRSFSMPNE